MKLIAPTAGRSASRQVDRGHPVREERAYRRDVQMVFQDPYSSLNPRMTVGSIIGYPMRIQNAYPGPARDARIRELLELVGLSRYQASWYPHEFSGGERQRVGIAAALALNPKFIFCDEPVSSLDVSAQAQILNLLKDVRREFNLTILIVTHNLSVVEYLSDRVVVMYLGKIVEVASTADLYRETLHPYSKALVSAIPTPDPDVEREREQIILRGRSRARSIRPRVPLPHPMSGLHRRRLPRRRAGAARGAPRPLHRLSPLLRAHRAPARPGRPAPPASSSSVKEDTMPVSLPLPTAQADRREDEPLADRGGRRLVPGPDEAEHRRLQRRRSAPGQPAAGEVPRTRATGPSPPRTSTTPGTTSRGSRARRRASSRANGS